MDTFGSKNKIQQSIKEKKYCVDCGKEISYYATRCVNCEGKLRRKVERPDRNELKQLIRNKSFLEIGKIYHVSDNSIRRWCDEYKLPRRKSDIKAYSDTDWELV